MIQRLGVRAPILLVGGLIVTMAMEPRLGAVLLLLMPLMGLTIYFISKKGIPMYTETQRRVDRLVQTVRENVVGIRSSRPSPKRGTNGNGSTGQTANWPSRRRKPASRWRRPTR